MRPYALRSSAATVLFALMVCSAVGCNSGVQENGRDKPSAKTAAAEHQLYLARPDGRLQEHLPADVKLGTVANRLAPRIN